MFTKEKSGGRVRPAANPFHVAVAGGNMNVASGVVMSESAVSASRRFFRAMLLPLSGSTMSLSRPPLI